MEEKSTHGGWWYNRAYVDEPELSPQQYHDFFDNCDFGISFKVANAILKARQKGYLEECVPCDELRTWYFDQIRNAVIANNELEGALISSRSISDEKLHWRWDVEVTDEEGCYIDFFDLSKKTQNVILESMLKGCRMGEWLDD